MGLFFGTVFVILGLLWLLLVLFAYGMSDAPGSSASFLELSPSLVLGGIGLICFLSHYHVISW